jgi:hypothetical protein
MTTDPRTTDPAGEPAAGALLTAAFGTLVRDEPAMRFTVEDVERRGRLLQRRRRRTRVGLGAGMLVAASGAAFLSAGAPGWSGPRSQPGVALGPTATPSQDAGTGTGDIGGTSLPVGFPVNEVFVAVQGALPDGVRLGDLPADVGWEPGGPGAVASVRVPLARDGVDPLPGPATLQLGPRCTLERAGGLLDAAQAQAVADAVCAAWTTWGRPDPLAVPPAPSTPPDPAA